MDRDPRLPRRGVIRIALHGAAAGYVAATAPSTDPNVAALLASWRPAERVLVFEVGKASAIGYGLRVLAWRAHREWVSADTPTAPSRWASYGLAAASFRALRIAGESLPPVWADTAAPYDGTHVAPLPPVEPARPPLVRQGYARAVRVRVPGDDAPTVAERLAVVGRLVSSVVARGRIVQRLVRDDARLVLVASRVPGEVVGVFLGHAPGAVEVWQGSVESVVDRFCEWSRRHG